MSTTATARTAPARVRSIVAGGARIELVEPNNDDGSAFLRAALERVAELGCLSVVVEGGPTLHRAFWDAGLVDRVQVFVTPEVAGPGGLRWDVLPTGTMGSLDRAATRPLGEDILIEGYVHRPD